MLMSWLVQKHLLTEIHLSSRFDDLQLENVKLAQELSIRKIKLKKIEARKLR